MKLSVIVVTYDMQRELPRTLQSLAPVYQQDCEHLDYEVLVIDNGSPQPMDAALVASFGPQFHYHYLHAPPPSPAYALNYGASQAGGDILCFMIDGAHLLTPGVFKLALQAFRAFDQPVVMTRYFFLGPGSQNDTLLTGYDKAREDALLAKIDWPRQGYRLFEIGVPLQFDLPNMSWFHKMVESNCLFMQRQTFDAMGGAEQRFDIPGGGFLNIDLCQQAIALEHTCPVQLVGEGSFHQLHGGTTTNVDPQDRDLKVAQYEHQYRAIRGRDVIMSDKGVMYLGHLPTQHSKIHLKSKSAASGKG